MVYSSLGASSGCTGHTTKHLEPSLVILIGDMNVLSCPAFFENMWHSNVIGTAAGGFFGHKDDPKQGAMTCRQGEEVWKPWKASYISLSDGVVEYVKTQDVKRRWAAQVDLQCRQQSLIGKRRRSLLIPVRLLA